MELSEGEQKDLAMCKMQRVLQKRVSSIRFKKFKNIARFRSKPVLRGKMPIIVARARQIIFILQSCTNVEKVEVVAVPVISSTIYRQTLHDNM